MANNVKNVTAGKPKVSGGIWRAPSGTPLPVDAKSQLSSAFKALGYVSDDGVSNENTADTEQVKAWGGDVVMESQTSKPDNFSFTLIEATNTEVLKMVYGENNVSGDLNSGIAIKANSEEQEECVLVIDMALKDNTLKRICIPNAKVTEVGEITYNDSDPVGYETTVSCLPDTAGNTHYEYIVKSQAKTIVLDKTSETVAAGSTATLTATTIPSGGEVAWSSSDELVATVSNGVVSGVAAGTAVITAAYETATATCTVEVTE